MEMKNNKWSIILFLLGIIQLICMAWIRGTSADIKEVSDKTNKNTTDLAVLSQSMVDFRKTMEDGISDIRSDIADLAHKR